MVMKFEQKQDYEIIYNFGITTTTANIIYITKIIAQAKLHMQPKQQWYNYKQKIKRNFREA
jgi:hypothetical protein